MEMNGLHDVGFVWVVHVSYLGCNYQCQYREAGLLGTRGVIWGGLQNVLCLDFGVVVTNSCTSNKSRFSLTVQKNQSANSVFENCPEKPRVTQVALIPGVQP